MDLAFILWTPNTHNDMNVLLRSSLFARRVAEDAPPCNYVLNDCQCTMSYYLADDICPPWVTFVKTILRPEGNKRSHFTMRQELTKFTSSLYLKASKLDQ